MDTVITVIQLLVKLVPVVVQAGTDLQPFAVALFNHFNGKAPTAEELVALEAKVDELAARLQVPLPAAQPGDPDYVKPA